MPSSKFGSKFLGEERYQQYVEELTAEGTIDGEQLSPEERKEGFKKRNDKIGFQDFVEKVLDRKQSATVSKGPTASPGIGGGGALVKAPAAGITKFDPSKITPAAAAGDGILEEILKIVTSIRDTLIEKNEFDADQSSKQRQSAERAKRAKKEKGLESNVFAGLAKGVSKVLAPVKGLFEKVFDFIKTVVLGRVVVKLVDWFTDKDNKEKVDAIGKFLEKTWPALLAAYLLFGNSLGRFVTKLIVMVGRFTARLIAKAIPKLLSVIAANPITSAVVGGALLAGGGAYLASQQNENRREELDAEDDASVVTPKETREEGQTPGGSQLMQESILQRGMGFSGGGMTPMGTDTVPAMLTPGEFVMSRGAVNTFGSGFMEMINAAGGGNNKPKNGYFSAGGYVPGAPDAKDKSEYSGGRSMAARIFDPLQVFSKDKPDSSSGSSGSFDSFAKEMIKVHEGLRLDKYLDSRGFPTIGYGHLIEKGESMPDRITKEKADELFDEDYMHHKKAAEKIPGYNRASGEQKAAIIDLTFNMGPAWADGFPAFKKAFAAGDYQTAGDELINSAWYGQVGRRAPTIVNLIKGKGTSGASYLSSVPAVSSPASASSVMPSSPTTPPPVSAPPPTFDYKKIRQELGIKTSSVSKSSRPSSTAAYTQMQQGQQQSPQKTEQSQAPGIPSFDAAAMSSPKKIKTLGITV